MKKPRIALCAHVIGLALLLTAAVAWAQPTGLEKPGDALLADAASYAALRNVGFEEAVRRLKLQRETGELNAYLSKEMRDTFAGLWIQHEPDFRIVARFTEAYAGEDLKSLLADKALGRLLELRPAGRSLAELEGAQAAAHHLLRSIEVPADSEINVFENRVDVFVVEHDKLLDRLSAAKVELPEGVAVTAVDGLLEADQAALNGGQPLSTCTGGFTVRQTNTGELGISTAAHCGNVQFAMGISLPFRAEDITGNQDVQWHSACDLFDVSNNFNSGIGLRACTGTVPRNNQAVGSLVCKFGMTTGRTCGWIQSTSVMPSNVVVSPQATFVRVDGRGALLRGGGDSGGPWFVETLAYGSHHGGWDLNAGGDLAGDAIYMPINYISSLGVAVLTSDPGPCNLLPTASFTWTKNFGNSASFNASGSSDPDGTIVSYNWSFGDGTSATTSSATISHTYPYAGSFVVILTVTDNEGGSRSSTKLISLCTEFLTSEDGSADKICVL